jgi:hypothetical protein
VRWLTFFFSAQPSGSLRVGGHEEPSEDQSRNSSEYALQRDASSILGDVAHAKIPTPVVIIPSIKKITGQNGPSITFDLFSPPAQKLERHCRDSRSHDLTEPIESILRIPEANNPPNAPASGEQTGSPSQTHQSPTIH